MGRIAAGIAFFVAVTGLLSVVTMLLWNALVPVLFHGPTVTFGQALGLLVLSHILFRGGGPWRHAGGWKHEGARRRLEAKMAAMTPEERERFRAEWRRCGWFATDCTPSKPADPPSA
jgi:hypothetical protein